MVIVARWRKRGVAAGVALGDKSNGSVACVCGGSQLLYVSSPYRGVALAATRIQLMAGNVS